MTTMFDAGTLDDVEMESRATWPTEDSDHPVRILEVTETVGKSNEPDAVKGWTKYKVKLEVANGDLAGKTLFTDFLWDAPRNAEGKIVPSSRSVEKWQADGLGYTEAVEKAVEGSKKAMTIGKQNFIKLMNAAGYIRMKDTKPGDSNIARINAGLAVGMVPTENGYEILNPDTGEGTGSYFEPTKLERRIVMAHTTAEKYNKTLDSGEVVERTGRKVKYFSDVDPTKHGDLGESTPF